MLTCVSFNDFELTLIKQVKWKVCQNMRRLIIEVSNLWSQILDVKYSMTNPNEGTFVAPMNRTHKLPNLKPTTLTGSAICSASRWTSPRGFV